MSKINWQFHSTSQQGFWKQMQLQYFWEAVQTETGLCLMKHSYPRGYCNLFQAGIRRPWECPVGAGLCWAVQCCCRTVWALSSPTCTGCWGCSGFCFQPGRCSLVWWKVPVHGSVGIRGSLRSPLTQAILFFCISRLWRMLTMLICLFCGGAHCLWAKRWKEKVGLGGQSYLYKLQYWHNIHSKYLLNIDSKSMQSERHWDQRLHWYWNDWVHNIWLQLSKFIANDLIMVFHFAVSQGLIKFHPKQQYCLTAECIEAGKQQFYPLNCIVIIVR